MKLNAQITPYSSTVGGGLTLLDEEGRASFMVLFCGTTRGISKEQTAALAKQFSGFIEEHGLEVPEHE